VKELKNSTKSEALKVNLSLFLLFLLWPNSYALIKLAGRNLSPYSIALLRFFIVFPLLFFFPSLYRIRTIEKKDIIKVIAIAILIVPSYHLFLNSAETILNASVAALIAGSSPLITSFLSVIFLKERLSFKISTGLIISLLGVVVLTYGISGKFEVNNGIGVLLSLASVSSWAIATVISKPLFEKYRPLDVTIWAIFIGTLLLLPFVRPNIVQQVKGMNLASIIAILYLGYLSILLGYIIWYRALERKKVSTTAAFVYLNPIIGSISGVIILGEKLNTIMIIGGVIIILGLFFINPLKMEG
jgi:drug/metabolite transporter (DMT)-like permease